MKWREVVSERTSSVPITSKLTSSSNRFPAMGSLKRSESTSPTESMPSAGVGVPKSSGRRVSFTPWSTSEARVTKPLP